MDGVRDAEQSLPPPLLAPGGSKPAGGRSKKHGKKRPGGNTAATKGGGAADVVVPADSDLVRVVKVERSRADNSDAADGTVLLSRTAKAAQLSLSEDRLSVTGSKGYRSVRATHGVHEGAWYCEVKVSRLGASGHVRLGWTTRKAELQAPAGFDKFGYSYRDLEGSKVHNGCREPYAVPYQEGDVVGLYVYLPPGGRSLELNSRSMVRYKGALYHLDERLPEPAILPGSVLAFAVNGVCQGVAFSDVFEGTYYPSASLFTLPEQAAEGACVTFNFGPEFAFPPPGVEGCPEPRPFCEAAAAAVAAVVGEEKKEEQGTGMDVDGAGAVPAEATASVATPTLVTVV